MDPDEITPPKYRQNADQHNRDEAVGLIRGKLDKLYNKEPDAKEEAKEVKQIPQSRLSKHQKFMKQLTESDKKPHEIQTAWHEYYVGLPEVEKHQVWKEFYSEQAKKKNKEKNERQAREKKELDELKEKQQVAKTSVHHYANSRARLKKRIGPRQSKQSKPAKSGLHQRPRSNNTSIRKISRNQHVKSLAFGLSMGFAVLFILLFSFFNERFITPFIRPSGNVSATPIIVDPNTSGPVSKESKIIIPKINIEAPVVYDVKSVQEEAIQDGLERGVVHYPTTPMPGETGNSVIFGHSSGNILNKGKYKFAFLLLKSLDEGDTFIVQKDGKRYVYKVFNEFVTTPDDFSVLDPTDRKAIMTLITCDPPGTSTNRLIIQAEQIFPNPDTNKKAKPQKVIQPEQLPSNSRSLWSRITDLF